MSIQKEYLLYYGCSSDINFVPSVSVDKLCKGGAEEFGIQSRLFCSMAFLSVVLIVAFFLNTFVVLLGTGMLAVPFHSVLFRALIWHLFLRP